MVIPDGKVYALADAVEYASVSFPAEAKQFHVDLSVAEAKTKFVVLGSEP